MNEPILKKRNILDRIINNQLVVTVFTAILMVFVIVGSSYAIFTKSSETETNDVVVATGDMEVVISSSSDTIVNNYTNLGVTDEVGLASNSYDFAVTNTGVSGVTYYEIRVVDKEYSNSMMPHKALNFSISKDGGEYTVPQNLGENGSYIYTGESLEVGESHNFSLKLWVTEEFGELARDKVLDAALEITLYNEIPNRNYIMYDLNGGVGFIPKTSVSLGKITNIIPKHQNEVLIFVGWSSDKASIEPEYLSGDVYDKKSGITLYAIWKVPTLYEVAENKLVSNLLPSDGDARIVAGQNDVNNYVSYSGRTWQIISLNDDGTMKLLNNDNVTLETDYVWTGYKAFEDTAMFQYLNNDFFNKLNNPQNVLVTNYKWNGTEDNSTTFEEVVKPLETKMIEAPVGLLNLYEYISTDVRNLSTIEETMSDKKKEYQVIQLAGPSMTLDGHYIECNNYLSQMNSLAPWFLITTHHNGVFGWEVSNSAVNSNGDSWGQYGCLRPSIVLKTGLLYSSGDGSKNKPFEFVIE